MPFMNKLWSFTSNTKWYCYSGNNVYISTKSERKTFFLETLLLKLLLHYYDEIVTLRSARKHF